MKKATKILSLAFALAMTASMFAGCRGEDGPNGGTGGNREEDTTKTQLYTSNYEGGYGRVWLDNAIARFEKEYENYEFEPGSGKKGIQIHVDSSINGKAGSTYIEGVTSGDFHVHFTEDTFYYDLTSVGAGADITDIVTKAYPGEYWDEAQTKPKTIESKMDVTVKEFFGQETMVNGEEKVVYKGLPHYFSYRTLYYDVDIFDAYGLWMKADGTFLGQDKSWNQAVASGAVKAGTVKKEDYPLSKGIDGNNGTEFDGLPATYDEFFKLLDYMLSRGVEPIHTYGSGSPMDMLFYGAWAQNEGRDSFLQTVKPEGTSDRLVSEIAADGTVTMMPAGTQVDGKNVQAQLGKYQAFQLAKRLAKGTTDVPYYFHDYAFSPSENNITAQGTYIFSAYEANAPIAFYMDGVWWENEAAESLYFEDLESLYGVGRYDRKFGLLPIPFADASYLDGNQKWTVNSNTNLSLSFINGNLATDPNKANILKAAKEFLWFLHSDEELQNFTVQTSTLKPFNYEVSDEKAKDMTYFGKQMVALTNNPNVDILYTFSDYAGYLQNFTYYYPVDIGWQGHDLIRTFFNNPSMSAADLFWQVKSERNSAWKDPIVNN